MAQESRYSKVFVKIWHSKDFRTLSEEGKILFLYLLTSPHRNMGGLYYLPFPYLCFDVGLDEERVSKAFEELTDKDMAQYDYNTQVVLIKKWFCYNPIENENQAKGLNKQLAEIPKSKLFKPFVNCVKEYCKYIESILKGFDIPFENPSETLSKPYTKPGTGTGTGTVIEREIDARARDNTSQKKSQEVSEKDFSPELEKINNKAFEFGMSGVTPEFREDAEMRLSEGTDVDLIIKALSIGATNAHGNAGAKCRYAIRILQGWAADGIRTLAQWEAKNTPEPKARDKPKIQDMAKIKQDKYESAKQKALQMLREKGVISSDGS